MRSRPCARPAGPLTTLVPNSRMRPIPLQRTRAPRRAHARTAHAPQRGAAQQCTSGLRIWNPAPRLAKPASCVPRWRRRAPRFGGLADMHTRFDPRERRPSFFARKAPGRARPSSLGRRVEAPTAPPLSPRHDAPAARNAPPRIDTAAAALPVPLRAPLATACAQPAVPSRPAEWHRRHLSPCPPTSPPDAPRTTRRDNAAPGSLRARSLHWEARARAALGALPRHSIPTPICFARHSLGPSLPPLSRLPTTPARLERPSLCRLDAQRQRRFPQA
jgi:hypothetical protein